jgi:hypothetical protein
MVPSLATATPTGEYATEPSVVLSVPTCVTLYFLLAEITAMLFEAASATTKQALHLKFFAAMAPEI